MNLETKPQKNHKKWDWVTFSCNFDSQVGHLWGGRASHFFHIFSSLGPFWAPLGSKLCQGLHYETIFLPCWVRFNANIQKEGNLQWETKPNIYTKTSDSFWKLASVSSCVSLYLGWFFCAEYSPEGMEAPGGIGRNADGWSGHGGGEAEGQWIKSPQQQVFESKRAVLVPPSPCLK